MSFFDSDVVRAEMTEISELQEDVYRNVFKFPSMNNEEKLFHVSMLERLVDKQKNSLYTFEFVWWSRSKTDERKNRRVSNDDGTPSGEWYVYGL